MTMTKIALLLGRPILVIWVSWSSPFFAASGRKMAMTKTPR